MDNCNGGFVTADGLKVSGVKYGGDLPPFVTKENLNVKTTDCSVINTRRVHGTGDAVVRYFVNTKFRYFSDVVEVIISDGHHLAILSEVEALRDCHTVNTDYILKAIDMYNQKRRTAISFDNVYLPVLGTRIIIKKVEYILTLVWNKRSGSHYELQSVKKPIMPVMMIPIFLPA